MAVDLFHWAPVRPVYDLPVLRRIGPKRTLKNFGDEIGPMIVRSVIAARGLLAPEATDAVGRLFSVGSVMHFAAPGDHVWGTGINGKVVEDFRFGPGEIVIHAVRGPRTRDRLREIGFEAPDVFGDPGLLLPHVDARYAALRGTTKRRPLTVLPNLNDLHEFRRHPAFVSPLQDPLDVARIIAESEMVVGSSLHAMVFADALGVPSRLIGSANEHPFKYEDYYSGTGRERVEPAPNVESALKAGAVPLPQFDPTTLLDAFPEALFRSGASHVTWGAVDPA